MSAPPRLSESQQALARVFAPLDGAQVPGGCASCDAFQTVTSAGPGIWRLTIHHDDACPELAERMARR